MPLIALDGDVTAIVGTKLPESAKSGIWEIEEGPTYFYHSGIDVSNTKTIYEATCIFKFTGIKHNDDPLEVTSEVTLTASNTRLKNDQSFLLKGDSISDEFLNTLVISNTSQSFFSTN